MGQRGAVLGGVGCVRESLVVGFVGGHVLVLVEVQDHQGHVAPVEFVQPLAALAVPLQELDFLAHHPDRTLDPGDECGGTDR